MNRVVRLRPEAEADALEARDWYESRREGLGAELRMELDTTIARIVANSHMYRPAHGETRRAVLDRLPYAVYFRVTDDEIVVLATVVYTYRAGTGADIERRIISARKSNRRERQTYRKATSSK